MDAARSGLATSGRDPTGLRRRCTVVLLAMTVIGTLLVIAQVAVELDGAYVDGRQSALSAPQPQGQAQDTAGPAPGAAEPAPDVARPGADATTRDDATATPSLADDGLSNLAVARAARLRRVAGTIAGLAALLASIVVVSMRLLVFRPLMMLRTAMHDLSQGDLDRRLRWGRADDIGLLARQFDDMASDLGRSHEQLATLATQDPLTGLLNQRAVDDRLGAALRHARRHEQPLSLAMFDIDHFKQINDSLGHQFGDEVLRCLAEVLRSQLRPQDVCGRRGGDEFVVAFDATDVDEARAAIQRVAADFRGAATAIGARATISAGVAVYPHDGATVEVLVHRADQALYRAKAAGRDTVEVSNAYDGTAQPSQMWRGVVLQ